MYKGLSIAPVIAALLCRLCLPAQAVITPAPLFTDNAVLQRGQDIPVWGTAEPSERITVEFNGETAQTTASPAGEWSLRLRPQSAGGPYKMTLSGSQSQPVVLRNVAVGEVWLCSGQSNMEYPLSGMSPDALTKATIPTVNDPLLRFVMVARTLAPTPQTHVGAQWKIATADAVAPFSAVAYYFARDLRRSLNVPVGIIESAYGGTYGQSWMSREALASQPILTHYIDEEAAYAPTTYPQLLADYQAKLPEYQKKYGEEKAAYDAAKAAGNPLPRRPALPAPPQEPARWQAAPTRLFNGMIAPLIPYGIRGAVWYQGEGNWNKGYEYHTLLPTLISDWRRRWKQGDFPFYIVQLPPNGAVNPQPERSWLAEVREAQRLTALNTPNTFLVVTTDVGDQKDIHPYRKEAVGQRLGFIARANVYGEKIESSGPIFSGLVPEGRQIRVKFTRADGLHSAPITDHSDDGSIVAPSDQIMGFTIAGADLKFFNATAKIEGQSVLLSAPEVASPVAVRYGWSQFPLANLQNSAGLWASPFRTDNERLISQPRENLKEASVSKLALVAMSGAGPGTTKPAALVYNGDFSAPLAGTWNVLSKSVIPTRVITSSIEGQKQSALQLELNASDGASPWDVVLKAPDSAIAIPKGDILGVQFWARSSQTSKGNAVYQGGAPTFEKPIRQTVNFTPQWQKFTFFAPTPSAYPAGGSNFELQLGQTSGTFEVAGIRAWNLGAGEIATAPARFAVLAAAPAPTGNPVAPPAPTVPIVLRPRKAPPYIVLKLDDVGHTGKGDVPPRWQKLTIFLRERNLKAALGIITTSLEGDNPKYIAWLKEQHATGRIEFWDHGYTHKEWDANGQHLWEFKGTSYEEQKDHFLRSQALAKEKLGFSLPVFGPGFNATDENTVKAISEVADIKVWLYGDPKQSGGKVILPRPPWLGIENPLFVPSLDKFVRPYNNQADADYLVIQGHPNMWDDARFNEFTRIIDFLTEQKAIFVTPSELVTIKNLRP